MEDVKLIRHCREQSGLSQAELGDRVGVTRQTIAAWEREDREPSVAQLVKIAQVLGVSVELLLQTPQASTATSEPRLMFRADTPSALTPYLRATLSQKSADYAFVENLVQEVPTLPALRPLKGYDDYIVEEIAHEIRDWLGMGEACPLGDVLALLESKGLKVILHPLPNEISGFSAYTETDGATIFVNENHPTERKFFTGLHELAHLIFHRQEYRTPNERAKRNDPREKAANHFAGAVLLPKGVIWHELHAYCGKRSHAEGSRWLPEPLLIDIKRRYGVSMRTVLYRAAQVELISSKQKGQQIGILNKRYGINDEPVTLPKLEHLTRLDRLVYLALLQEQITTSRAAEILGKPLLEVRESLNAWLEDAEA